MRKHRYRLTVLCSLTVALMLVATSILLPAMVAGPLPLDRTPSSTALVYQPVIREKPISPSPEVVYKLYGLNFSPFTREDQDANLRSQVGEDQIREQIAIVAPHTYWVRTFGVTNGLEKVGQIAHEHGLKAAVGAWLTDPAKFGAANEEEIANLISVGQAGHADLLIVGTETLYRRDLTEKQLLAYIDRVKKAVPGVPVATADVYDKLLEHRAVIGASDVVLPNYYPYWIGVSVDDALAEVYIWHQRMLDAAAGKPVVVSETGWPSDGTHIGEAVASPENAAAYFLNFVSWARAENVPYFYFGAFDEPARAWYEGPEGAHFGIWDKDSNMKPGMESIFAGKTNWSTPGGPGNPSIEITSMPPHGSADKLHGQVGNVNPAEYKVAVYIRVEGRLYNKPGWTYPLTFINANGSWKADVVTDEFSAGATDYAAFLVPNGYSPPLMPKQGTNGGANLPQAFFANAVAQVEAARPPNPD